ncbi:Gfo/Idh/MocA family protein [Parapedobacter deserti]|uniref:Gfo/Idh/MocA family protein n=1 Tax=Parapedobacter deserti TaxID=1912957 RepID=A0ABV7JMY6_9SPHI
MKKKTYSRKEFVKSAAVAAAGFMIIPRHVLGGKGFLAPSDKITVGIVGAGGKGRQNAEALLKLKDVQITAIADPVKYWDLKDFYYKSIAGREPVKEMIESHYRPASRNFKISEYIDFREMLEKESSLDAIMCSTPDNTHAYVTIKALRAGKHVYCEKPLTHNIWEARKVREVALETGLATQMGNALHSGDGIRQTVEYLRDGAIGRVKEAHTWVPASRWNPGLKGLPTGPTFDEQAVVWDLWLGPTPYMPCRKEYIPVRWRDFWSLGCGALGDFGCHDLDASTWAFNLQAPESVEVHPAGYSDADIAPYGEVGYYHFAKKGDQPEFKQVWYSGGLRPARPEIVPDNVDLPARGSMFIGKKGVLITGAGGSNPQLFPEKLRERYNPPKLSIPRSNGHFRDWVDAIKGGPAASSNFEYGARLTEITLLGVLSLRLGGKKIRWDSENMKVKGLPEADRYLREPVRPGWEMV